MCLRPSASFISETTKYISIKFDTAASTIKVVRQILLGLHQLNITPTLHETRVIFLKSGSAYKKWYRTYSIPLRTTLVFETFVYIF
jgi:hypothetical protein